MHIVSCCAVFAAAEARIVRHWKYSKAATTAIMTAAVTT